MNEPVRDFLRKYVEHAKGKILEVGSFDVNGNIRDIVPVTVGVDMTPGRGVDLLCKAENLPQMFPADSFDTVLSFETMEHTEKWQEALLGIWHVLKTGGYYIGTIASLNKGYHGYPHDYWRLLPEHLVEIFQGNPLVANEGAGHISHGWVVQKLRPLGDLSQIQLIPILDEKAIKEAAERYNTP